MKVSATEVFESITTLILSNIHKQNKIGGQGIDTVKIAFVKLVNTVLGPLMLADEKSEITLRCSIRSIMFLSYLAMSMHLLLMDVKNEKKIAFGSKSALDRILRIVQDCEELMDTSMVDHYNLVLYYHTYHEKIIIQN